MLCMHLIGHHPYDMLYFVNMIPRTTSLACDTLLVSASTMKHSAPHVCYQAMYCLFSSLLSWQDSIWVLFSIN